MFYVTLFFIRHLFEIFLRLSKRAIRERLCKIARVHAQVAKDRPKITAATHFQDNFRPRDFPNTDHLSFELTQSPLHYSRYRTETTRRVYIYIYTYCFAFLFIVANLSERNSTAQGVTFVCVHVVCVARFVRCFKNDTHAKIACFVSQTELRSRNNLDLFFLLRTKINVHETF